MSIYLVKKQWGYQTCCPVDEDTIVGYFKPENPDTIKLYSKPNFDSIELQKIKSKKHEQWKYDNAVPCNMTLRQMDKTFGIIYNIGDTDLLIGKSNSIWGFEEKKDKENQITWIKINQDNEVWAPFDSYDHSTSDEDSDENPQDDLYEYDDIKELLNTNSSDEKSNDEVLTLCAKTKCPDSPQNTNIQRILIDKQSLSTQPKKKQKIG
jgi:hypothetical protein